MLNLEFRRWCQERESSARAVCRRETARPAPTPDGPGITAHGLLLVVLEGELQLRDGLVDVFDGLLAMAAEIVVGVFEIALGVEQSDDGFVNRRMFLRGFPRLMRLGRFGGRRAGERLGRGVLRANGGEGERQRADQSGG